MKGMTRKDTVERTLLSEGFIVWVVRVAKKDAFFAMVGGGESDSSEVNEDTFHLWHSAYTLFSPYVPVFHKLQCKALDDEGVLPPGELEVHVSALVCCARSQKLIVYICGRVGEMGPLVA